MKVGILTFHSALNYGAILQAYALQETLKNKKVDVEIINYSPSTIEKHYTKFDGKKSIHKVVLKNLRTIISRSLQYNLLRARKLAFQDFVNKNVNMSKITYSTKNLLQKNIHKYDVVITGSDQVWNPKYAKDSMDVYFLAFENSNVKKVSYAASIGNADFNVEDRKNINYWLDDFSDISVRERKGYDQISKLVNKDISINVDPTLLLSSKQWLNVADNSNSPIPSKEYILVYGLEQNSDLIEIVNKLSEITKLKVVHFGKRSTYNNELLKMYTQGPSSFIQAFNNAEYVITNSFHGTVFSVIFKKQFINIPHKDNNSRMDELLTYLNLKDRVVDDIVNIDRIFNEINYEEIDNLVDKRVKESNDYLDKVLKVESKTKI